MEAKVKHIGMKKMARTSSVKMCDFILSFSGIQIKRFGVGKSLLQVFSTGSQKPRSNKTAFSEFFFPRNATDVSVTFFLRSKRTQITETIKTKK